MKKHGNGEYRDSEGVVYSGSWVDGKMHGKQKIVYLDGRAEITEWENGVQFAPL